MKTARETALMILLQVEQGEMSHIALEKALSGSRLTYTDQRLVRRLVKGTLEKQLLLDHRINQKSHIQVEKMKPRIRQILRMTAYQIFFMEKIPDAAAIHEAVNIVKKSSQQGLAGFVNAVLRSVCRETDWGEESEEIRTGIPSWILDKWREERGEDALIAMLSGFESGEPLAICRNSCLIGEKELLASLKQDGVHVTKAPFPEDAYFLNLTGPLTTLESYQKGWIRIMDISSMMAARMAVTGIPDSSPSVRVLDVCAAPGGKSLFMAQLLGSRAQIRSCDLTAEKVKIIRENAARTHTEHVAALIQDARKFVSEWEGKMDVVLADLPCSGLGVIGRKPEIRFLVTPEQILSLQRLQRQILENACRYLAPGGILLYSTCTITREENEANREWILENTPLLPVSLTSELPEVLRQEPGAADGYIQLMPGVHPCDGFFMAKFRRDS